jgi:hypothetical protein
MCPAQQAGGRRRRPWQSKKRGRRQPELVLGLPLRGQDDGRGPHPSPSGRLCARGAAGGRIPVHQRLGPRVPDVVAHLPRHRRFSPPDSDDWRKVLPRQSSRPARPRTTASRRDPAPRRCPRRSSTGVASTACRTVTVEPPAHVPRGVYAALTQTTSPGIASVCARRRPAALLLGLFTFHDACCATVLRAPPRSCLAAPPHRVLHRGEM